MDSSIEIVRYRPDHREQVLRLQRHLWSRDLGLNRAYFAWKYEDNPYLAGPNICLALHGGEVVGMRGIVGARWWNGTSGHTLEIPFADDFVIAPAYRGQGLAAPLIRAACAYARDLGFRWLLSLRAGPLTLLDSLAAGFRSIGAMEPVGRTSPETAPSSTRIRQPLQRVPVLWRWADSALLQPARHRHPFRRLDRRSRPRQPGLGTEVWVERAADPAAMAEMTGRLSPDDRVRHVRDRQFFDWVFRNPRLECRFLYHGAERLEGYLVLHRQVPPGDQPGRVWISDWEGTSEAVCRDLLQAAIERGRFTELATWTATFPESTRAMLNQCGFEPIELEARARGRPAALIWPAAEDELDRDGGTEGRRLTDLANWKFRLLDQD